MIQSKQLSKSSTLRRSFVEAVIIALIGSILGIAVSFVHPRGIPLVEDEPYEIIVPCKVPGGKVKPVDPSILKADKVFIVDARSKEEFDLWHPQNASLLTYDFLDAVSQEDLTNLANSIVKARALKVVVYGDGSNPDTGELLGKEISGRGIKNVYFIKGGIDTLKGTAKTGGAK
ncbi:MAG: rhodanese-like domain-containing protein [Deltaproteobacteria bacterium]|nr:rhodanese-like domain-containing protein [Deltaproteobacteria bacterium]